MGIALVSLALGLLLGYVLGFGHCLYRCWWSDFRLHKKEIKDLEARNEHLLDEVIRHSIELGESRCREDELEAKIDHLQNEAIDRLFKDILATYQEMIEYMEDNNLDVLEGLHLVPGSKDIN